MSVKRFTRSRSSEPRSAASLERHPEAVSLDAGDAHVLTRLFDLLGRVLVFGADLHALAEALEHLLGPEISTVLDRLLHLDLVHQAEAALDVEAERDAALEGVRHPLRRRVAGALEARPEDEARVDHEPQHEHKAEVPTPVHAAFSDRAGRD
jgi:hypothetical protein